MRADLEPRVRETIRNIPDWPKPGIQFKDISTLLADPALMDEVIQWICRPYLDKPNTVEPGNDVFVGLDARGFLFGLPAAIDLRKPFVMCRKAGKLPGECISYSYALEYGEATVELQKDAFPKGSRVLIIDDLLATGGTVEAAVHLVLALGGTVTEAVFITELGFLPGRARLEALGVPVRTLVTY